MEVEATNTGQQPRGKVKLDVGGFKFTTSRATLCRFPGTFLEGMFSGRHEYPTEIDEEDGSYFIDRDGRHFHHVLNFLRCGYVVSLPDGDAAREELAAEGDFYGLEDLVCAIRHPQVDVASHLSPEMVAIREEEDEVRRGFITRDSTCRGYEKHHGLVSLFAEGVWQVMTALKRASIRDRSLADFDHFAPIQYKAPVIKDTDVNRMNLRDNDAALAKGCNMATCESLDQFKWAFNRQHPNILNRLKDVLASGNIIIAGGSVLQALTSSENVRTEGWWDGKSDVDLFVYGVDRQDANTIARRVYDALAIDNERWGTMRSAGVINFHQQVGDFNFHQQFKIVQKVQVVLRIYDSPTEILFGFDVDCCCCAFDGKDVWLTKRCISALRTGMNVLNPIHAWPAKASYDLRLAKYAHRGFSVLIPGFDESRFDFKRILTANISSLKGLARLLKICHEVESDATILRPVGWDWHPPTSYTRCLQKPGFIPALRKEAFDCREPAEFLTSGCGWYDGLGVDVIFPSCMCIDNDNQVTGTLWHDNSCEFPQSDEELRNEAWEEIHHCVDAPESLATRLWDAWDTDKRSREYLNSKIDSFDLNNVYYSHAFKK